MRSRQTPPSPSSTQTHPTQKISQPAQASQLSRDLMAKKNQRKPRPAPDGQHGGPGVSTGPPETVPHLGDINAQELSEELCKMEEEIADEHGFNYSGRIKRRLLIMTLPTLQGWQVMTCVLQAGTKCVLHDEITVFIEQLVQKRWACLKAGNIYMSMAIYI